MLLVYWENDLEVTKYKDIWEFMHGRESFNNVRIATELTIVNGEIKAKHHDAGDLEDYAREDAAYHRS